MGVNPHTVAEQAVAETRQWVQDVVIGLQFCPFAAREVSANRVRYAICNGDDAVAAVNQLIEECRHLDTHPETATTLLLLTGGFRRFGHYLDLLAAADRALHRNGYRGVYQVASFHPDYLFAGTPANDPANYTNRSPWPMLHLLREDDLEKAIAAHPDPEGIPARNAGKARQLGLPTMQALLRSCLLNR